MRKKKGLFFSHNHINVLHRKIDWAIRITTMIAFIVITSLITFEDYSINLLLIAAFFHIVLDLAGRAFFQYEYSHNPKQFILTISEGVIISLAIGIVIEFDLLTNLIGKSFLLY